MRDSKEKKASMKKNIFQVGFTLIILSSLSAAGYFYWQYQIIKNDPQKVAEGEVKKLVRSVSQLALLPTGEDPVVATITEPEKLKNQPFFVRAEKGDKLLVYNKAGKAYLYRPGLKKIVDATNFNPQQVEQTQKAPQSVEVVEEKPDISTATSTGEASSSIKKK
jgi:hypothetical protein